MVTGGLWSRDDIPYYRIDDAQDLEPFLMTVASASDLWMFVSSSGGLTAGASRAGRVFFRWAMQRRETMRRIQAGNFSGSRNEPWSCVWPKV